MTKVKMWAKKEYQEFKTFLQALPPWIMTIYVLSVVMMNLLANKSLNIPIRWLALDAGIIVSWVCFLVMDIVVRIFGPKATTELSIFAIMINLVVALLFFVAASIKGSWGESFAVTDSSIVNTALDNTLKGTWYVLLGSTVAFIASSIVNNVLNWGIGLVLKNNTNKFLTYATRSYVSTMAGQFVDNLVFALIVSLNFFGWTFTQCLACSAAGAIVELLCEVAFSPIGYRISQKWEKQNINKQYVELVKND